MVWDVNKEVLDIAISENKNMLFSLKDMPDDKYLQFTSVMNKLKDAALGGWSDDKIIEMLPELDGRISYAHREIMHLYKNGFNPDFNNLEKVISWVR